MQRVLAGERASQPLVGDGARQPKALGSRADPRTRRPPCFAVVVLGTAEALRGVDSAMCRADVVGRLLGAELGDREHTSLTDGHAPSAARASPMQVCVRLGDRSTGVVTCGREKETSVDALLDDSIRKLVDELIGCWNPMDFEEQEDYYLTVLAPAIAGAEALEAVQLTAREHDVANVAMWSPSLRRQLPELIVERRRGQWRSGSAARKPLDSSRNAARARGHVDRRFWRRSSCRLGPIS